MIITIECTQEEKEALRAMAEKHVVQEILMAESKTIMKKAEGVAEIKPAVVIATAKLIEYAAPLLSGLLTMFKSSMEAIKPYLDAVKKAAEEEG